MVYPCISQQENLWRDQVNSFQVSLHKTETVRTLQNPIWDVINQPDWIKNQQWTLSQSSHILYET